MKNAKRIAIIMVTMLVIGLLAGAAAFFLCSLLEIEAYNTFVVPAIALGCIIAVSIGHGIADKIM